ncbi:MAG TPA: 5'(3')-deoxyribonucleotidase [Cytophagaceae bacterium]
MKKRLIVDMDGVIADIYGQFLKFEFENTKKLRDPSSLIGKLEHEAFEHHDTYINTVNFFFDAAPIVDSVQVLEKLNSKYDLYIVSSAMQFPLSLIEKLQWLQKHFSFIHWKKIVFCGSKEIVQGDIMIDDHFKNLDFFAGKTILFSQPHNMNSSNGRHIRVNNWKEIEEIL